jgi:hypothetical protein
MGSRRWTGWIARLLPVLFAAAHLAPGSVASAPSGFTATSAFAANTAAFISSPRESLPVPVHDEATCAFCQAAAFAPHSSRAVSALVVDAGNEQRIHLTQENRLTPSASASPTRSRAPPFLRFV